MSLDQSFFMRTASIIAAALFIAGPLPAQTATAESGPSMAPVPFAVGEELVFHAKFGVIPAGSARMRVEGIDTVRGRVGVPRGVCRRRRRSVLPRPRSVRELDRRGDVVLAPSPARDLRGSILPQDDVRDHAGERRISEKRRAAEADGREPARRRLVHICHPRRAAFVLAKRGATTATSCRTATRWS